jgi:hypothetical protein
MPKKYARLFSMTGSLALAIAVAGCGGSSSGGGKAALVKSCTAAGQPPASCTCIADAAETTLSKPLFNKMVQEAKSGGDVSPQGMMQKLSPEEQAKYFIFWSDAGRKCFTD